MDLYVVEVLMISMYLEFHLKEEKISFFGAKVEFFCKFEQKKESNFRLKAISCSTKQSLWEQENDRASRMHQGNR